MHNRLALGRFPWHCMVTYKQLPGVRMSVHWKAVTTTKTLREKKFTKLRRSFVVVAESKELLSFKNNMANSSRLALWHRTCNFYPWHRHPFHMGTGLSHRCITSDPSHWQRAWESSGRCSKCVGLGAIWETPEFWTPGFGLAQPQLLQSFWGWTNMCLFLPLSLTLFLCNSVFQINFKNRINKSKKWKVAH